MKEKCKICGSKILILDYDGPIRSAGVGSSLEHGYKVVKCQDCKISFLNPFPEKSNSFYETDEYRREYDETVDELELTKKYEWEQNDRIHKIGLENLRGKTVVDFGCGLGLFLNCVKGVALETIAVEPMETFKEILVKKGHKYYNYPGHLKEESVDVAVCFDVLEHIESPIEFLSSIWRSLKKGASFYIAVPNKNDILMHVCKEAAQQFLYCVAHLFYFDTVSLSLALEKSGFEIVEKSGLHKYDFYNLISWLKNSKPCGRRKLSYVDLFFESSFKNELIRLGLSSHIFIKAVKE